MKTVSLERASLAMCVNDARRERVVITRNGKPIALIISVEGMDKEQLDLGSSDKFWRLIQRRRKQKTMTRAELEQKLNPKSKEEAVGRNQR